MSSQMASHAGRRQALAAQNMANVDTPGYRAKHLPSFADIAEVNGPEKLRATRAKHMHGAGSNIAHATVEVVRDGPTPDGNTVTVESEMLESISAKREHDRAIAVYKSSLKILHTTLARR